MPRKLRVPKLRREAREAPSSDLFVHGDGTTDTFSDVPVFLDRTAAERAWREPGARAYAWARTDRMTLPGGARAYDRLTARAWGFLWGAIHRETFGPDALLEALDLLAADRASVAAFEAREPQAAEGIAPYLVLWREDLDVIAEAAHVRADGGGAWTTERFVGAHRRLLGPGSSYGVHLPGTESHAPTGGRP